MTYVANRHQRLIEIKFSWTHGDCCIHPPSIVSHSFSSACKWQLLRMALQPTWFSPSMSTLHIPPLFPFSHLSLVLCKSVLFTPLDDDGKESVCFPRHAMRRHFILSTACPGRLCRTETGSIRGCASRWWMQRSIQRHFPDSLTLAQLHAIWLLYHPVRRSGIKDATCVFFFASLAPSHLILGDFLKGAFNDKYHMAVGTGAFISVQKRSCNNVH